MSRIGYSEDEDFSVQFELWQANCYRSIRGAKGQAALRELEAALLAMPEKRLIAEELENKDGDVCAIGALARMKGHTAKADPDYEMEIVGMELGMPRLVAWKVVEMNDITIRGKFVTAEGPSISGYRYPGSGPQSVYVPVTPESRYEQVLAWVQKQLHAAAVSQAKE